MGSMNFGAAITIDTTYSSSPNFRHFYCYSLHDEDQSAVDCCHRPPPSIFRYLDSSGVYFFIKILVLMTRYHFISVEICRHDGEGFGQTVLLYPGKPCNPQVCKKTCASQYKNGIGTCMNPDGCECEFCLGLSTPSTRNRMNK